MTEAIMRSIKSVWRNIPATPDLWPETDYKKHVPSSTKELMAQNWERTGKTLCRAMEKVRKENEPEI